MWNLELGCFVLRMFAHSLVVINLQHSSLAHFFGEGSNILGLALL